MKITRAALHNYRSIAHIDLDVADYLVLLGPNNHGKSNILSALEFALTTSAKVTPNDFFEFRSGTDKDLWIDVTFARLTDQERRTFEKYVRPDGTLTIRKWAAIDDSGDVSTGYRGYIQEPDSTWLKPAAVDRYTARANIQADIGQYPQLQPLLDASGRITKAQVEELQKNYIRDNRATLSFTETLETTPLLGLKSVASGLLPEFFLLPAVKDLVDETKVNSKTLFGRVLQRTIEEMTRTDPRLINVQEQLQRAIGDLNVRAPEGQQETSEIGRLERILADELRDWTARVSIEIQAPEITKVFELGTLLHIDDGHRTLAERKGHGLQRAVIFSLIRAWARMVRSVPPTATSASPRRASESVIFAIEEPEMFLHPHAQRQLARTLCEIADSADHQVLCCTHSTHFVDLTRYRGIGIVRKTDPRRGTQVRQCRTELFAGPELDDRKHRFNMAAWFNPDRSELFFARKVVLVEGPTEKACFPYLAEKIGCFDTRVSLVDCASKHNLPLYIEVLKAFALDFVVIHDEDPLPDPIPAEWSEDKRREKQRTFALNAEIVAQVGAAGRVHVFRPDIEGVAGISGSQSSKKGKPIAAFERFEPMAVDRIPADLSSAIRLAYT